MKRMTKQITNIGRMLALLLLSDMAAAEVVVVAAAQGSIETLSDRELEDIYLGRLNRLPSGDSVVPVDQAEGSAVRAEFYDEYLGRTPAQIKAHWSKLIFTGRGRPPHSVADDAAMADFLAGNPGAIGYMDSSLVDGRLRVLSIE